MLGDFTHDTGADVGGFHRRNHEHRLEVLGHVPIHERHLELVFEVAHCAKSTDVELGADLPGEVDEQPLELRDLHVFVVGGGSPNELDPFFRREQRALRGIHGDSDNEMIDEFATSLDQVLVAARDRIEASSIDGRDRHVIPLHGRK